MNIRRYKSAEKRYLAERRGNLTRFFDDGIMLEATSREGLDRHLPGAHKMAKVEGSDRPFAIRPAFRVDEQRFSWWHRLIFGTRL